MTDTTNFFYNSVNQLVRIEDYKGCVLNSQTAYAYDAIGRRVEKIVDNKIDTSKSKTRRFTYSGESLLEELDELNNTLAVYTYSPLSSDDILSKEITDIGVTKGLALSKGDYYYIKDALGTVTHITNSTGDIIQKYAYNIYGTLISVKDANGVDIKSSATVEPYLTFAGRELDSESGLYYLRARYFDSVTVRVTLLLMIFFMLKTYY